MFFPPGVRLLLIINVAMLLIPYGLGGDAMLDAWNSALGLHYPGSDRFAPYQLVTHMFMHGGFSHLLFNMLGLVVFGRSLEELWGTNRFLVFYLVCGLGAGLLYMGVNAYEVHAIVEGRNAFLAEPSADALANFLHQHYEDIYRLNIDFINDYAEHPNNPMLRASAVDTVTKFTQSAVDAPMIGASGAVFGVMAGFGLLFPNVPFLIFPLPIPVAAKYMVLFYGAMALKGAIHQVPGDNVAHYAHLGGMLVGWLLIRFFFQAPTRR